MGSQFTRDEHIKFELATGGFGHDRPVEETAIHLSDIYLCQPNGQTAEEWADAIELARSYVYEDGLRLLISDAFDVMQSDGTLGPVYNPDEVALQEEAIWFLREFDEETVRQNQGEVDSRKGLPSLNDELQHTPAADDTRPSNPEWANLPSTLSWPYNTFPTDEEAAEKWLALQADKARVRARRAHERKEKGQPTSQAEFEEAVLSALVGAVQKVSEVKSPEKKMRAPVSGLRERPYAKGFGTAPYPIEVWMAEEALNRQNTQQNLMKRAE